MLSRDIKSTQTPTHNGQVDTKILNLVYGPALIQFTAKLVRSGENAVVVALIAKLGLTIVIS